MRRFLAAFLLLLSVLPALAQSGGSGGFPDLSTYAKKTDVPGLAPVQSVTGQTGAVQMPTICGNASIPAGNTVTGPGAGTTETPFTSTCVIPANTIRAGTVMNLHVGGIYSAGTGVSATGKVHYTNAGTPAPLTDVTPVNTGPLNGVAGASSAQWIGDVYITFQSTTQMDVQAELLFQALTPFQSFLPNTTTFTIDPTKDLTFYLTVQWSSNAAQNTMQLRTLVAK